MRTIYDHLAAAAADPEPFALGLLTSIKGSSPQKKGAKAIFYADGRIVGTLGGGCLEAEIQDRARRALASGQPATFELVLDHDFGWDDGLICGGKVNGLILPQARSALPLWQQLARREQSVDWGVTENFAIARIDSLSPPAILRYRETVTSPVHLWIAGAGHVSQAVAHLADPLDFQVTIFDDRPALAHPSHFPAGTRLLVAPWDELLRHPLTTLTPTFGLIMTRGHQHDGLALSRWIHLPFAYLGMIGSQRKKRLLFEQLIEDGSTTAARLSQVFCPIGLPIQSQSVPEIAVSIVAQLIQCRAEAANPVRPKPPISNPPVPA